MATSRFIGKFITLSASVLSPLVCLASPQSETFLKQADCRNFVRNYEEHVILGGEHSVITIDRDGRETSFKLKQNARDALIAKGQIFVLADTEIIRIDAGSGNETGRAATQKTKSSDQLLPHEKPRALSLHEDHLLVAHGTLGVSVLELDTLDFKTVINLDADQTVKSLAQDVAVAGDSAFVLVDNFQISPVRPKVQFRGILQLDLERATISNRFGGLDPGATAFAWHQDSVLVSFGGNPVWKLRTPLRTDSTLQKGSRLLSTLQSQGRLVGHFSLDDQYVWSCKRTNDRGSNAPAIFERSILGI